MDVAIIGLGTAGRYALGPVSEKTENYRIFEGGEEGTTCARVGCMPSKALIHIAEAIRCTKGFSAMGIKAEDLRIDRRRAMEYVREKRDVLVRDTIKKYDHVRDKLVKEETEFVAPMALKAGGKIYRCRSIIISTGSRPIIPRGWQLVPDKIITTETLFELESLSNSVLIVGLGPIGIEIGQALARIGSEVTGAEMLEKVADLRDPEIRRELREQVGKDIEIKMETRALLDSVGDRVEVTLKNSAGEERRRFDLVILATGREPNLERLKLENSGLELDGRGSPVYDRETLQCGNQRVFIAGDANGVKTPPARGGGRGHNRR